MKRPEATTVFLLLLMLAGCTTVGTGHRTVVRAACADFDPNGNGSDEAKEQRRLCDDLAKRYPHLVVGTRACVAEQGSDKQNSGEERILRIDPEGRPFDSSIRRVGTTKQPTYQQFRSFLEGKYGSSDFKPVELSFAAHDRTVTPPFLSVDPRPTWLAGLTTLFLNTDKELPIERRIELRDFLEAQLRNVADLGAATAHHHTVVCSEGCFDPCVQECKAEKDAAKRNCAAECLAAARLYYYYPRVSVDFSSSFLSTTAADRLSYLALLIRLRDQGSQSKAAGSQDQVRFIDFRPKDADIIEFSRGDLTQGLTLTVGTNIGATGSESLTVTEAPRAKADATGSSSGLSAGATFSETLASKLADSIEKKTTGILEDGRTFYADFRSLRQIRVAGAYNFDLMLEVPSNPERHRSEGVPGPIESSPILKSISADVYLLGVVRHVHDRGRMGLMRRVPESENDHVFEQVVLRILPNQQLWVAPNEPYLDEAVMSKAPSCTLQVLTNREEASFIVRDERLQIIGSGTGRKADLSFSKTQETCGKVTVTFLPIVLTTEGTTVVLEAMSSTVDLETSQIVEGGYRPTK